MNQEVKELKAELSLLKLQFSERVNEVESRLNAILEPNISEPEKTPLQKPEVKLAEQSSKPIQVNRLSDLPPNIQLTPINKQPAVNQQVAVPAVPTFITKFFQFILSSFFEWFTPVTKIYQSYKERGMLGIFILTIVGIGLTLAGFGYLMQLLIDQLGAGSKSLLMCTFAIAVMVTGIVLKVKTRFDEFATAIVTLGVLLSYSTIYFSGSVYGIIPNIAVLLLYFVIALGCHALALWLETKIVASLGVIGIATMPILSSTIQVEPLYYLLSLAFVASSSLFIAYKKDEQWLANLSLAFCLVALEWTIGFESVEVSTWIVDLFYLLFFAYITVSLLSNREPDKEPTKESNKKSLILLAALVGSTVLFFFQTSSQFSTSITLTFTVNTLVAIGVCVLFYRIKHELTHLMILLTSLWAVLTVISALSDAYWGIAWAVEGLLLLYIGRRYAMGSVVNQGQVLTAIALLYSLSALLLYFPLPALKSVDGWTLSIVIVVVIASWQRLLNNTDVFGQFTINKIKPFLQLFEVVWITILLVATLDIWLGNWTGAIIILLQIAWLFRAKQCRQVAIEIFAALLILVPLYYVQKGIFIVDSYRFMMLPLFAKVSAISAFLQLWLWSAFYRKYQPNSNVKHIAESVRIFFYMLLPIFWISSSIRRLDENVLSVLWLSPLIALFLAKQVKHNLLVKEAKILTVLASIIFTVSVGQLDLLYSLIALAGFCVFYGAGYLLDKKDQIPELGNFVCNSGVIALGFALPSIIGWQTDSLLIGFMATSLIWLFYIISMNLSKHLLRNKELITVVNIVLVIFGWVLTLTNSLFVFVPLLFLIAAIARKKTLLSDTSLGKTIAENSDLFLHTIGAITYITLFYSLVEFRIDLFMAPVLAVHGALILFLKDKRIFTVKYSFGLILLGIIKLALIDAASAQLWQKVMLFMGIGIFILVASFWYQKLIKNTEQEVIESA